MQPRLHAAEFAPSTVSHGCMHGSSGVRKRSNPDIVLSNLLSLGHGKWVIAHHLGHQQGMHISRVSSALPLPDKKWVQRFVMKLPLPPAQAAS